MVLYDNRNKSELGVLPPRNKQGHESSGGSLPIMDAFSRMTDHSRLQPSTIDTYKWDTIHLVRFIETNGVEPTLGAVSSRLAHDWIKTQEVEGYSSNTVRKRVMTLMTLYRFSMELDLVKSNPFKRIHLPYVEPQTRPKLLSFEEIIHIMKVVQPLKEKGTDIELLVRMLLFSGLKRSQLMNVTVNDVEFEKGMIRYKKVGHRHRYEVKPITPLVGKLIEDTIRRRGLKIGDFLLRGLAGKPIRPNQIDRVMQKLSEGIGWTEERVTIKDCDCQWPCNSTMGGLIGMPLLIS